MTPLFKQKDNADAQLNASINASTLTLIVKSGQGSLFPQPIKSSATSLGTSTVLNKTSAESLGLTVNDYIFNITDGSWAFIVAVNTNDIETTPLYGGVDNTWESADEFVTRRFVATLNKRDSNGNITQSEQVLIDDRSGDTLTVPTGGRGYNGTTPLPFNADDYLSILVDELLPNGIESTMSGIDNKKFEKDLSQPIPNNTTLKGRNNAGTNNIDLLRLNSSDILEFLTHPRTFAGRVISNAQDLVDKEYYEANLPAGGTITYTLAENMTAEDLVKLFNDAGTRKARKLIPDSEGTEQGLNATNIDNEEVDCVAVDSNRVVVTWASSNVVYAICFTISGTVLTIGTRVTIAATSADSPTIAKLSTDKFVICYRDNTNTDLVAMAGSVSGTAISTGSPVILSNTGPYLGRIIQIGTDKFAAIWVESTNLRAVVATVTGTTIGTPGTTITIDSLVTAFNYVDGAIPVSTDKFYVVLKTTSGTEAYYCTVSGTAITANARPDINSANFEKIFNLNSTHFAIYEPGFLHLYRHDNAGVEVFLCTQEINFTVKQIVQADEDGKFVIIPIDSVPELNGWRKGWLEDNCIKYSRGYEYAGSAKTIFRGASFASSNNNQFAVITGNTISGAIGTFNDFEDFSGILQTTGTTGQSLPVAIKGELSDTHSFTASEVSKDVYIQEDGSLDTVMTHFRIGKVYDATKMIINT